MSHNSTGPLKIIFDFDEHDGIDIIRIYCKEDPERHYIKDHIQNYIYDNFLKDDMNGNGRYSFTGAINWSQDYFGDWDEVWDGDLKLVHKAEKICCECKKNRRTTLVCEPCRDKAFGGEQ